MRCSSGCTAMRKVADRSVRGFGWEKSHAAVSPFRDTHRFPSARVKPVLTCTRTPRTFGILSLVQGAVSVAPSRSPVLTIRNFFSIALSFSTHPTAPSLSGCTGSVSLSLDEWVGFDSQPRRGGRGASAVRRGPERPPDPATRVHGVGLAGRAGQVLLLPQQLPRDQDAAGKASPRAESRHPHHTAMGKRRS